MSERDFKGIPEGLAAMTGMLGMSGKGKQKGEKTVKGVKYRFLTGIVKEVYSNPGESLNRSAHIDGKTEKDDVTGKDKTVSKKKSELKSVENAVFFPYAPMNSVQALIIDNNNVFKGSSDVLCFPFFPPHFSLPVKPGEYVWILEENIKGQNLYYWMCRKVGIRQVDDINITHLERTEDVVDAIAADATDRDMTNVVHFKNSLNSNVESGNSFEEIQTNSLAYREEFTGEPVPRYAKGCGDLVIQGSNNALISLGLEKFVVNTEDTDVDPRLTHDFNEDLLTGQKGVDEKMDHRKPMSPAIDICIGRKLSDITKVKEESFDSLPFVGDDISVVAAEKSDDGVNINNKPYEHMEVNKIAEVIKQTSEDGENNLEFIDYLPQNCMSRIYMSNNKMIDEIFQIPSLPDTEKSADIDSEDYNKGSDTRIHDFTTNGDLTSDNNFSSITMYSANLRMAFDASMKIYNYSGNSMISMSPEGDITLQANGDQGGKIILEAGGNVRVVPGPLGVLKLGDDFGDGRSDNFAGGLIPVNPPGTVQPAPGQSPTAGPMISSAAGSVLEPAGTGKESTKIIMK